MSVFTSTQIGHAYPKGMERHYWHRARAWIIGRELKRLGAEKLPILDVGCGLGFTVKSLREGGFDCFGIEASVTEPDSQVKPFIQVGKNLKDLPQKQRNDIKVLLFLDVLEHIEDPKSFLEETFLLFPHLEKILITVPARQELWSNFDEFYGHYRRYSLKEIKTFVRFVGGKIFRCSYFFQALYPPLLMLKIFKKNREIKLEGPSGFKVILNKIVELFLKIEYVLLPKFLPGSSIIVTFEK